jgi:NAD(P)-dependent dehydrogenase (short-subunit alcohol dehydrogenase family)
MAAECAKAPAIAPAQRVEPRAMGERAASLGPASRYGPRGVRFNVVHPGYIKTEMTAGSWDTPHKREARTRATYLKRWGEGADMAGVVLFLCSPAAAYATAPPRNSSDPA